MEMRRSLLVVAVGITFLILTWLGTLITSIVPHRATAQEQTTHAGAYQVTLLVNPNPPLITRPAALSIRLLSGATQQPIINARVTLQCDMAEMDMSTGKVDAHPQGDGTYLANLQFSMSGLWHVHVNISAPGPPLASADFAVTAR
jgi:YtkA-like